MANFINISGGTIINGSVISGRVINGGTISGNGVNFGSGVEGNGKVAEEARAMQEPFDSVVLDSSVNVNVQLGKKPGLSVKGESNLLDLVTTEVRDGALHVGAKGSFSSTRPLQVDLSTGGLSSAVVNGSGDLLLMDMEGPAFEAVLKGSGDVTARGHVDNLSVKTMGSGDFEGEGLEAATASAEVYGSGDIEVQAQDHLEAKIFGSGDIGYLGTPAVSKSVMGSGEVESL